MKLILKTPQPEQASVLEDHDMAFRNGDELLSKVSLHANLYAMAAAKMRKRNVLQLSPQGVKELKSYRNKLVKALDALIEQAED